MARVIKEDVRVPVIVKQVSGDLRLKGRGADELIVDGEGVQVEQVSAGQPYVIRSRGDCRIALPSVVEVTIEQVGGDAKLTELNARLEVQAVGGDLLVNDVREVALGTTGGDPYEVVIGTVGGDLRIKRVDGPVHIARIGGDATIRDVAGPVHVERVGADLFLRAIDGSCIVEGVGADLVLHIDFTPGNEYHFDVGADALCWVHPGTSAHFLIPRQTEVGLDTNVEVRHETEGDQHMLILGGGETPVTLELGGDLRLVGDDEGAPFDFGLYIEEEVAARLFKLRDLSSLQERFSEQLDGLDERIAANAAQWASQAEHWAERAQEHAEQLAERFSRGFEPARRSGAKRKRGPRRMEFFGNSDAAPRPGRASDPVSEEERLLILQMVQDGRVSVEEAERLLAALEAQE